MVLRASSQPVAIPEIPPFRKNEHQHSNYPPHGQSPPINVSPPLSAMDIPAYKPRKSKDFMQPEQQQSLDGSHPEHQLTIGASGGAEWTRRLKVAEQSPIHRSTDCIISKELGTSSDSELLKPAPSWSNVALKTQTEQAAGTSSSAPSVPKATTEEAEVAPTPTPAEIAVRKSRLKQKLVKSARSVAIFSLKLKERRAKEAERVKQEKADELAEELVSCVTFCE